MHKGCSICDQILELINPVSHTLLELVPTPFIWSPYSASLRFSILKLIDNDVMINLNDDLGLGDIEIEWIEGRATFYRSLGNNKWFNSLIDPY